jgi:hypothetical protein
MRLSHSNAARAALAIGALVAAGAGQAATPEYTQTFLLQPGWNSVYLEVRPEPNDCDAVFLGLPIASAWTWNPRVGKIEFIEDPDEALIDSPAWQGYFPRPRPESVLTNLFSVQANKAYLIKIEGEEPVTWSVTGRPEVRPFDWVADSFNLAGFAVDPAIPVSFASYLAHSPAHAGQPVYRLVDGVWQPVNPATTQIRSGEAYWVYTQGPSQYQGPIEVDLESGKALEFGGSLDRLRLRVRNLSPVPASITVTRLPSNEPVELALHNFDSDTGQISWPDLPANLSRPAPGEGELFFELAPRRGQFVAPETGSILAIRNGFGFRRLVAVSAKTVFAPPAFELRRRALGMETQAVLDAPHPLAGLWVGSVSVRGVSQAQTGGLTPTPAGGGDFGFRVLVHVDAAGSPRLLKEVIQLWQEGTRVPDPTNPGMFVVDEPGHFVLVTDETLIPTFAPAALRDGQPFGYRISTAAYDFEPQWVAMNGSFSVNGTLSVTLTLDSEAATNPFRHKFHPDHDNLDPRYLEFREEAYAITRELEFEFSATDPFERSLAGYGESEIGGVYRETLSGLHRNDIAVEGLFLMRRVSARAVLNQ